MIIPVLHTEKQVQVGDLIRFDADKSVLVKGSVNPINSVKIKPGASALEFEVYHSNSKNWFLDFVFNEYQFDVDPTNSSVKFETGGASYTANILTGTYDIANLLIALKAAIELAAPALTVSISIDSRNRVTVAPSMPLKLLPKATSTDFLQHIGFTYNGQLMGTPIEYGLRKVTLTVASISESTSIDQYVEVYTPEGDALFSEDSDLVAHENDIMKWLPQGKSSFTDLHRRAQRLILDWVDRQGYRDDEQKRITKFAFVQNADVRVWSTYVVLKLFFMGVQNQTDDVFKKKALYYEKLEIEARDRAVLNLDLDNDGKEDKTDGPDIRSGRLFFR